jgi:LysR family transcriptional regulator, chromosome initiation inhibitor
MSLLSNNLQAFLAVTQAGSVHGAAIELKLTQTGVTQRIRALENQLSTTLFLRSRLGMKTTKEGEALLQYCKAAKDLEGPTLSRIDGARMDSPIVVTIIGPTSILTTRVINQILPLQQSRVNWLLNCVINDEVDRVQSLRSGLADLAIVAPDFVPNELDSKLLKPDRYVLVATNRWKARKLSHILSAERMIDFHQNDYTTLNYLKKFKLNSRINPSRIFANSNEIIIKMFVAGIGYGSLTLEVAKPFLDSGDLIVLNDGSAHEERQAMCWYPRPQMPGYFQMIVDSIK